jgi:hypothetical protein
MRHVELESILNHRSTGSSKNMNGDALTKASAPLTDRAFEPADPNVFTQPRGAANAEQPLPTFDEAFPQEPKQAAAPTAASAKQLPTFDEAFPETADEGLHDPFPETADEGPHDPFPEEPANDAVNDAARRKAAGIMGPLKGAVMPGPVGDWIFGNTRHSSLARIMAAFGHTVHEDVGDWGKNLYMSDETAKNLKEIGFFNDYVDGQASLFKTSIETLARSGALLVNTEIYGVPAILHRPSSAIVEAGEQAEGEAP